jgi:hypothetical protein
MAAVHNCDKSLPGLLSFGMTTVPAKIIALAFLLAVVFGITATGSVHAQTGPQTNPATGESVAYVPKDVPDAVRVLKESLTKEELAQVQDPSNMNNFFVEVGLRNSWGLWKNSRLAQWFVARGVQAPEDMTSIIVDALRADLNKRPFALEKDLLDVHAGELQAEAEAKQSQQNGLAAVAKIKDDMLGLKIVGKSVQVVTLPTRQNAQGLRVRYMAPFAGGYLIADKWYQDEDSIWSRPYFLQLAQRSVRPIRIDGMKHIENAIVLAGTAWLEGPGPSGEKLVAFDGKTVRPVELPPGSGTLRFGQDGDKLLALRPRAIYRWEGDRWITIVRMHDNIPFALVPPARFGNRIYLRDEGQGEDNKRLWWIDLDSGHIASFDEACGLVTPEGPRWENVWSYAVEPGGRLWLSPGYSLVRWDRADGYRVGLMNGKPVFDGQLIESQNPDSPQLSQGWTLASNGVEKTQPFASVGLLLHPDGALDVMGPNGLFRVAGDTVTPLLAFTHTAQNIPKNKDDDGLMDWALDPTHFLPLDHDAYLIGSHWYGVYLLAKDTGGVYHFTLLDGNIGPDITPTEIARNFRGY